MKQNYVRFSSSIIRRQRREEGDEITKSACGDIRKPVVNWTFIGLNEFKAIII